jgi:hypothetical protein
MTDFDTLEDLQQADPLLREIQRLKQQLKTYAHIHKADPENIDRCLICHHDIRDWIHSKQALEQE